MKYTPMGKGYIAAILCFAFVFFSSCQQVKPVPSRPPADSTGICSALAIIEEPCFNNFDDSAVNIRKFNIVGGDPYQLCVIRAEIYMADLVFQKSKRMALYVDDELDINGRWIGEKIISNDTNTIAVKRVVKLNNEGKLNINLQIGNSQNNATGRWEVSLMEVVPIGDDNDYAVYTSDNQSVEAVFMRDSIADFTQHEQIQKNIELLCVIRDSIKAFVGGKEPYEGTTTYICTELVPYSGLAGNPIYINYGDVDKLLGSLYIEKVTRELKKTDFISVFCHEMSHTFDGINSTNIDAPYNFEKEFFALLKQVYALNDVGFSLDPEYIGAKPSLDTGIYSYEVFLSEIMQFLDLPENDENWQHIKSTMYEFDLAKDCGVLEAFSTFIDNLSNKSGVDLKNCFGDKAWETLYKRFGQSKSSENQAMYTKDIPSN